MERYRVWIAMLLGLLLVAGFAGCKKSPASGGDFLAGGLGGIDPLGPEWMEGMEGMEMGPRGIIGATQENMFPPVYFQFDSSNIDTEGRSVLEQVAETLRTNPGYGVIVEGHCCETGSREYNLGLGERRAQAARAYLIGLGVDAARIQTQSYGQEKPAELGSDEVSLRLNRRAEFVLYE